VEKRGLGYDAGAPNPEVLRAKHSIEPKVKQLLNLRDMLRIGSNR